MDKEKYINIFRFSGLILRAGLLCSYQYHYFSSQEPDKYNLKSTVLLCNSHQLTFPTHSTHYASCRYITLKTSCLPQRPW